MICQRCESTRILEASAHADDRQAWRIGNKDGDGYLPGDFGIGRGEDMMIAVCLDCGQLQGKWPLPPSEFETSKPDEDGDDDYDYE